jgi:hypothetical protein
VGRYVPARPSDKDSCAGQELNIAQAKRSRMRASVDGEPSGLHALALGKVTAGFPATKGEGLHAND